MNAAEIMIAVEAYAKRPDSMNRSALSQIVRAAIEAAILAERESCAELAQQADEWPRDGLLRVAQAIRSRSKP